MKRRRFLQSMGQALLAVPGASVLATSTHRGLTSLRNPRSDDWFLVRQAFPLTRERIYFNTGGLGPSPYAVLDAVEEKRRELEAICETGHQMHQVVREKVARFLNADPQEIAFTRNATEGMNFVARGIQLNPGDEIITSTHEHPGGAMPWLAKAKQRDLRIRLIEPVHDDPRALIELIRAQLTPRTRVLMLSHIFCTIGSVTPVQALCAFAREQGLVSVIDGAQAVGQIPVDLHGLGCDFYVTSGHKWLLGPKETGVLYISRVAQEKFRPSFVGAYSDAGYDLNALALRFRDDAIVTEYGTRDAAKIWGIGAAVDFLSAIGMERVATRARALASYLREQLIKLERVTWLTPANPAYSAGIATFRVEGIASTEVTRQLAKVYRIRVRNIHENNINATRISLHIFNSFEECDALAAAIHDLANA